jgi:hypothetical protein
VSQRIVEVTAGGATKLKRRGFGADDLLEMSTVPVSRIAALYRAQTATEGQQRQQDNVTDEMVWRARLWQATLAKSMADLERKQRRRSCQPGQVLEY